MLPEGEGQHPVLRVVHGGPFGQDTWAFFDEAQVYASAGYAVVIGNPRGSGGYGLEHGRAVIGAMGTVDVDDVLALLDAALERPDLDETRVGIMGGSYGGFMTSWLAAHHGERFVAAWSERAVNAWDSFAAAWTSAGSSRTRTWVPTPRSSVAAARSPTRRRCRSRSWWRTPRRTGAARSSRATASSSR
ncbi:alpha/beta fold hydrolase [Curtobacterium flaccumfaciens]|nr:alpha/beta fold hydrolase [Curtobacterium flaccumfaciens]